MALGQRRRGGGGDGTADDTNGTNGTSNGHSTSSLSPHYALKSSSSKSNVAKKIRVASLYAVVGILLLLTARNTSNTNSFSAKEDLYNRLLSYSRYYNMNSNNDNGEAVDGSSTNTNECTIPRLKIDSKDAVGLGSQGPVLLEGWEPKHRPKDWSIDNLMGRVGDYPQYLKDLTVQPLKKKEQKLTTTSGSAATGNDKNKVRKTNRRQLLSSSSPSTADDYCILPSRDIVELLPQRPLLLFTNNKENDPFMTQLRRDYKAPKVVKHINSFEVFSAMDKGKYHSFHKHGESWLGQVEGRRTWWFLPPSTDPKPERVDACGYLTGESILPPNALTCVQHPGEIIWFPKDWYHATCAMDDWTVGIGAQQGRMIRQEFPQLTKKDLQKHQTTTQTYKESVLKDCLGIEPTAVTTTTITKTPPPLPPPSNNNNKKQIVDEKKSWKWFDGDLNAYYNSLEKDIDRDPTTISSYAVHRWMGPKRSTEEHYNLIDRAVASHHPPSSSNGRALRVFDGGCGLGSALMWMEGKHPNWDLTGHTISEEQFDFIQKKLPDHKFKVNLRSYDDIPDGSEYDVIYSIEALIHSMNITKTMEEWSRHLAPGGIVVIIDDYVSEGVDKTEEDIQSFSKSWLANVLITPNEFGELGNRFGLSVVENRDLLAEYEIVKINYRNTKPNIAPFGGRTHQGWMGSKWRQRLTVEGKLAYNMMVLQKGGGETKEVRQLTMSEDDAECAVVPSRDGGNAAAFTEITPQLMSGRGSDGGKKMTCISGWYCCNKGFEWYDHLDAHRTDNTQFLKLDRNLFGHYIDIFAKHLNEHYESYPDGVQGRFLDIGGTGSTASGMQKVTSKFQHFAGPLEYWKLDSDPAAQDLERTLYCDIDDCPAAENCGFDVTFSHTVLEHAKRPWKSFDTIARITKKGGLTMHLVPWSYQYHATPDDNYRFSHKALITLLEDRGFDVLEVGYDICEKPEHMKNRVDEHYDVIWLTYVVGRKR